ncbi:DNA topoisomerase IB [Variovorax sp. PAMC 28711]|uniref:DNA topoisomerase IB n=1 Tax=Variovorax sp. PAMC 28711 TaxID=1795631 RepID=UPI00078D7968|nr:DNA topoisomerase IB [Variovorax sp. PAMC 28711]AMM25483.1 DNA topoisomerase [Variovorax sp. PAMC 28711]
MPTTSRPPLLANGLVYVDAHMPGWSRVKRGTNFRYRDVKGKWLQDVDEISRIQRLAIPPAYTEVWICPLHNGHLQATGMDARGRKQYRYHADWRVLKDETKFERLEAFGRALPKIRARVARDLKTAGEMLSRDRVLATLVRLLDTTFVRVGNEEYASSNGSYGLTTLRNQHAAVRGSALKLSFRGKSGVMQEASLDDPRVAKVVRSCQQLPGQALFQYIGDDGAPHGVSSSDVNDYLRDAAGNGFTAKDFRTWHGTVQALELTRLACDHNESALEDAAAARYSAKDIIGAVAKQLGNTPAVCKKSYVHPAVLSLGGQLSSDPAGMQAVWKSISGRGTQGASRLRAAEARLLAFLSSERRRAARAQRGSASTRRTASGSTVTA